MQGGADGEGADKAARPRAAVVLAAGQGARMRSPRPKVLHPVGGRAMLDHAIDAAEGLGCARVVVVVGPHSPAVAGHVRARLGPGALAVQDAPRGTAHALCAAADALADFAGDLVVICADTPLMDTATLAPLFASRAAGVDLAVLGFEAADPGAYGRLVVAADGRLLRIVEAKDATAQERAILLCNAGVMAADARTLLGLAAMVGCDNSQGEFYLTDAVALADGRGLSVRASLAPQARVVGVNSQAELAAAEAAFQAGRRAALMQAGVCMPAPHTVHLAWDTAIAGGAVVEPHVVFGPGVTVEAGAAIRAFSHLEGARVRQDAVVGPYARLRPGADIGPRAHIGNFVEVKKTTVGEGAKANHLSYLGDGEVGAGANIGAGAIFCNYDGFDKARTVVEAGAFVGSNTSLVAPVTIGAGAYVGSGSAITADVAPGALALERGPQVQKPGWADRFRALKRRTRGE